MEPKNHRVGSPLIATALTIVSSSRAVALALILRPSFISSFPMPFLILSFLILILYSSFLLLLHILVNAKLFFRFNCLFIYSFNSSYSPIVSYLFSLSFANSHSCFTAPLPHPPKNQRPYPASPPPATTPTVTPPFETVFTVTQWTSHGPWACYDMLSRGMILGRGEGLRDGGSTWGGEGKGVKG